MERIRKKVNQIPFQRKLFYGLLCVSLIPFFLILTSSSLITEKAIIKFYKDQIDDHSALIQFEISSWIQQGIHSLEILSNLPELNRLYPKNGASLSADLDRDLIHRIRYELNTLKTVLPHIDAISLIDPSNGQIVIAEPILLEDRVRQRETYFLEGQKGFYISEALYSIGREKPVVTISAPIRYKDLLMFVAAIEMNLEDLNDRFAEKNNRYTGNRSYLVDKFGFYVTTPPDSKTNRITRKIGGNLLKVISESSSAYKEYINDSKEKIFCKYQWIEGTELCLLTEMDYQIIQASVHKVWLLMLLLCIIVLSISLYLSKFISKKIMSPIREITLAAENLNVGNLDVRIDIDSKDEIGRLSSTFNHMTSQLKASYGNLEQLIAERTLELENTNQNLLVEIDNRNSAENKLRDNIRFLETLAGIDKIIRHGTSADQVMGEILELVLSIFGCDRAWIAHPCDPDAPYWTVAYEKIRPGFQGLPIKDRKLAMTPDVIQEMTRLLENDDLIFGSYVSEKPCFDPDDELSIKSYLISAVFPKGHMPWEFGIHQCTHERLWNDQERSVFREIKYRIEDSLSILLILSDLKKSEARFKTIVAKSPLPMAITDGNEEILFLNEKFTEQFGYTLDDVPTADQWWTTAYPDPDYRQKVQKSWTEAAESARQRGTDIDVQVWEITLKDLSKRLCEFYMVPMGDVGVIVIKDITEQKRNEEKLRQAQKMESIGNLAGGIAHDFNNILFPIIGMAELLLEDLPRESPEYDNAKEILTAGKRGSDLVKQILTFSRQSEYQLLPVRIQKILKEVIKLCRATIPSNIELIEHIQQNCGFVLANPSQIHQIAMNIITNAYHAVESRGGKIVIELKESYLGNEDTKAVRLSISDNGDGIPAGIINKIFDPYFTTKEKGKGTGLGLAVVYGIVKEYGGDIKVYSEVGKGSVFNVYLPIMESSGNEIIPDPIEKNPTGTESILLVDDELSIARLEEQILQRLGYRIAVHQNSTEALAAFKNRPGAYDLVITDMTMPGLTGDQFVRAIKEIRPAIPVIICTGFSERLNKEKAEALGVNRFLMKPIIKNELATAVRSVLDEVR